jgi:16S rRNA (cytosine1402-N4)-methyltransferase
MTYHKPVLLQESIEALNIKKNGIYVDATYGGGGHSKMILEKMNGGKLFAFDQDLDSVKNSVNHKEFKLIHANFRYIENFLKMEGVVKIDGLLADLGVSSYQFDVPERGFSFRFNSDLDMRMNSSNDLTAKYIVNNYSLEDLANVFFKYGELHNSKKIASAIVEFRKNNQINSTKELADIISKLYPNKILIKSLARVFQAIRIEVNDEITSLKEMLTSAQSLLNPKGRIVIISYHSLEDRLVKNLIKRGDFDGIIEKDLFGNVQKKLREINRKVIVPSREEIKINSRARSAKLRIAEYNG